MGKKSTVEIGDNLGCLLMILVAGLILLGFVGICR